MIDCWVAYYPIRNMDKHKYKYITFGLRQHPKFNWNHLKVKAALSCQLCMKPNNSAKIKTYIQKNYTGFRFFFWIASNFCFISNVHSNTKLMFTIFIPNIEYQNTWLVIDTLNAMLHTKVDYKVKRASFLQSFKAKISVKYKFYAHGQ